MEQSSTKYIKGKWGKFAEVRLVIVITWTTHTLTFARVQIWHAWKIVRINGNHTKIESIKKNGAESIIQNQRPKKFNLFLYTKS